MNKQNEKEIRKVVEAYTGNGPRAPLDPDLVAVCAAAMKPKPGVTIEERRFFEDMQRVATGQK